MKEAEETDNYFEKVTEAFASACVLGILYPLLSNFSKTYQSFLKHGKGHRFWFNVFLNLM